MSVILLKVVLHKYDKRENSLTEYNVLYSRVYARVLAVEWKRHATHLLQTNGTRETLSFILNPTRTRDLG